MTQTGLSASSSRRAQDSSLSRVVRLMKTMGRTDPSGFLFLKGCADAVDAGVAVQVARAEVVGDGVPVNSRSQSMDWRVRADFVRSMASISG